MDVFFTIFYFLKICYNKFNFKNLIACHMFETSKDLLFVVLSLSIFWFTIFLCWLLYQAARTLRNINKISEMLIEKLELISEAVTFMRDKVDHLSSKMGVVSSMLSGLVEKFIVGKISANLEDRIPKKKTTTKKRKMKK